ncbi:hypothetical protein SAMN02799630_02351 [Paenibacillus sp. UNCCL117]|nr:hypothetical protein SAMN04488602_106227 [Paenibacillus sp. cl123]SFW35255.1 hypothetical protein SAMN02799630_02351 [Paenibacillus sp. UNCCL117]
MRSEPLYVYVLLTDTGTLFTKMIKLYTGASMNHASIALDADLKDVYSFGRKDPRNPLIGGFVREDLSHPMFAQADCAVYRAPVSREVYERMRRCIRGIEDNQHLYTYNLLGLLGVVMDYPIGRDKAYFCTQFVATVFEQSGLPLTSKPAALVTPTDLEQSSRLELVYRGSLSCMRNESLRKRQAQAPKQIRRKMAENNKEALIATLNAG